MNGVAQNERQLAFKVGRHVHGLAETIQHHADMQSGPKDWDRFGQEPLDELSNKHPRGASVACDVQIAPAVFVIDDSCPRTVEQGLDVVE